MVDWPETVRQYGPVVWKTVYRLLGNEADAADCFQETFVAALELSRRESIEHWAGLLQRVATARALNQLRRRSVEAKRRGTWPDFATTPSPNPGPVQDAEAAELAARMRRAIAQLPRRESEVICLRCLAGLSYEEIGRQLGLKLNAVGVLLHRARGKLRNTLESPSAERADQGLNHAGRTHDR